MFLSSSYSSYSSVAETYRSCIKLILVEFYSMEKSNCFFQRCVTSLFTQMLLQLSKGYLSRLVVSSSTISSVRCIVGQWIFINSIFLLNLFTLLQCECPEMLVRIVCTQHEMCGIVHEVIICWLI